MNAMNAGGGAWEPQQCRGWVFLGSVGFSDVYSVSIKWPVPHPALKPVGEGGGEGVPGKHPVQRERVCGPFPCCGWVFL